MRRKPLYYGFGYISENFGRIYMDLWAFQSKAERDVWLAAPLSMDDHLRTAVNSRELPVGWSTMEARLHTTDEWVWTWREPECRIMRFDDPRSETAKEYSRENGE